MISKLKKSLSGLFGKGFFHIAGSNILNRLIAAITNILIARFVGKYNYGVFGDAFNVYSIFVIFSGLGMYNAILVFCSEIRPEEEKKSYYLYGLISGFVSTVALSVGMLIYASFAKLGIEDSRSYIFLLAGLPLLDYLMRFFLVVLRSQKRNKEYAYLTNISSFTYLLLGCAGAYFFGIGGTIIGRYISYLLVIILSYRKTSLLITRKISQCIELGKAQIRNLWAYSLKNGASSALNQILYLIDVWLISQLIKDAEIVASYKVAVLIPEGLAFIPTSLMVFLVPIIAEHNKDGNWLRHNVKKLFIYSAFMNIIISGFLFALAPYIIRILWGVEYMDSVPCFRLLCINYFVMATFRSLCTNILAVLHKVNFNLVLGVISSILDIILDIVLIKNFGSIGAAIATVSTVVFISLFSLPYLIHTLKKIELEDI